MRCSCLPPCQAPSWEKWGWAQLFLFIYLEMGSTGAGSSPGYLVGTNPGGSCQAELQDTFPLGAEIRLLAEKFPLGKSIKGNFSNFSIQNKEGSLFFPLTLFKHLVSVLLEVIPAP